MPNPVLGLVRSGLQRWLRGQCDALDHLHLDLEGTAQGLLKGRLQAARLEARGVVRGACRLSRAVVTCQDLQLDLGRLRPGRPIPLSAPLNLRLEVWCSAADLQHMVLGEGDAPTGTALLAHFRGLRPGDCRGWRLETTGTGLRLLPPLQQTRTPPLLLQPRAADHGIAVHGQEVPDRPVTIPLDPALRIHGLAVEARHLRLWGEALLQAGGPPPTQGSAVTD